MTFEETCVDKGTNWDHYILTVFPWNDKSEGIPQHYNRQIIQMNQNVNWGGEEEVCYTLYRNLLYFFACVFLLH